MNESNPEPLKSILAIIVVGVLAIIGLRTVLYSGIDRLKAPNIAVQPKDTPVMPDTVSVENSPPPPIFPSATEPLIQSASEYQIARLTDSRTIAAATISDKIALTDPLKFQRDIHTFQKEQYESNEFPYGNSGDYLLLDGSSLSLHGAATVLAKALSIEEFVQEKDGSYINLTTPSSKLFFRKEGAEYRVIPRLNFQIGDSYYLIFDNLKRDGDYSDCHACRVPVSAIKYHYKDGIIVIDKLVDKIAILGSWGNAGYVQFVKYKDAGYGFIVRNGTMNQGYVSNWINAFKLKEDQFTELKDLENGDVTSPEAAEAEESQQPEINPVDELEEQNNEDSLQINLLTERAESGDAEAQFIIGLQYDLNHADVEGSFERAVYWYRKSAAQGHFKAQHNLSVLYHDGQGVPKNYEESYFWMTLAAKSGDEKSMSLRDSLEKVLPRKKVIEVQKRAKSWMPVVEEHEDKNVSSSPAVDLHLDEIIQRPAAGICRVFKTADGSLKLTCRDSDGSWRTAK